jgi:hypothetical protein
LFGLVFLTSLCSFFTNVFLGRIFSLIGFFLQFFHGFLISLL